LVGSELRRERRSDQNSLAQGAVFAAHFKNYLAHACTPTGFKTFGSADVGCAAMPERARTLINSAFISTKYRSHDDMRAIDGSAKVSSDLDRVGQLVVWKVCEVDSCVTQKLSKLSIVCPQGHEMGLAAAHEHNGQRSAPTSRSENGDLFHNASFLLSETF